MLQDRNDKSYQNITFQIKNTLMVNWLRMQLQEFKTVKTATQNLMLLQKAILNCIFRSILKIVTLIHGSEKRYSCNKNNNKSLQMLMHAALSRNK